MRVVYMVALFVWTAAVDVSMFLLAHGVRAGVITLLFALDVGIHVCLGHPWADLRRESVASVAGWSD